MKVHNLQAIGTASGHYSGSFDGKYNVPGSDGDILVNSNGIMAASNTFQATDLEITGALTASIVSSSYLLFDALDNGNAPSYKDGLLYYNSEDSALTFYNSEADISQQLGQEFYIRIYNSTGVTIANGTPVFVSGSQGDTPLIYPAIAQKHTSSIERENHIIGITTHNVENNSVGFVTTQGLVRGIDTTGFSSGSVVYLQTSSAGFRQTPPPPPYDIIQLGFVTRVHTNGFIFVKPKEPIHFHDISSVSGSTIIPDNSLWVYDSTQGYWYNTTRLSNIDVTGSFSGSFVGDGSGLDNVGTSFDFYSAGGGFWVHGSSGITVTTVDTGSYSLNIPSNSKILSLQKNFTDPTNETNGAGSVILTIDYNTTNFHTSRTNAKYPSVVFIWDNGEQYNPSATGNSSAIGITVTHGTPVTGSSVLTLSNFSGALDPEELFVKFLF